jgi:ketol-acid reductoisomerase
VTAGFETLVEAGYKPEVAYFECLHELKLIVDLIYRGGLSYMRYSISDTAEHGDYTAGPRIVTDETRRNMKAILADIQSGAYAERWKQEHEEGLAWFKAERQRQRGHVIEQVGARLRAGMPFLEPAQLPDDQPAGLAK